MPLGTGSRINTPFAPVLDLPPPFRAVALREGGDAFAHATKNAAEAGAGTLVHVGRFDLSEFAVVLEPDEPLRSARRALYAGLAALIDALAAQAPPEKPITIDWPATIRVDGGLVGGARIAWPADVEEDAPPQWLVFGGMIRTAALDAHDPGLYPLATALDGEGFVDPRSERLVESFTRHLMLCLDAWQQDGFDHVARNYLMRLAPEKGLRRAIDDNGDLLLRDSDRRVVGRRPLVAELAKTPWFDPETGGPRL